MTAHGYARVSRHHQTRGQSLDQQKEEIRRYYDYALAPRGIELGNWYTDVGSGRVPVCNRPAGARITQDLREGDHLIITKLDRGFRNARDALTQVECWVEIGITVHLLDIGVDTSTPTGQLLFGVMAVFAEFETKRRQERNEENKASRQAQGLAYNNLPVLWKRERRADGRDHCVINRHHLETAKRIAEWKQAGWSFQAIANHLCAQGAKRSDQKSWKLASVRNVYFQYLWVEHHTKLNGGVMPRLMPPPGCSDWDSYASFMRGSKRKAPEVTTILPDLPSAQESA